MIKNNSINFPKAFNINKNHQIVMNEGAGSVNIKLSNTTNLKKVKWIAHDNKTTIFTYHSKITHNNYYAEIPTSYAYKIRNTLLNQFPINFIDICLDGDCAA